MGHRDDRTWVFFEEALQPAPRTRRRDDSSARRVAACQAATAAAGTTPRAAARRPTASMTLGIPGREAQRIRCDFELALQFPALNGIDGILEFGLLVQRASASPRPTLGSANLSLMALKRSMTLLRFTNAFGRRSTRTSLAASSCGSCWQVADLDPRLRARLAFDLRIETRHDLQQRRLAGAVQAEHANLGAGEETEGNIAQDDALGGTTLDTRFMV